METRSINSLNDDCLERIFGKLGNNSYDLASVSLVSKRFLLITNRAKVTLIVSDCTIHLLPNFLRRFRNLKSIEFRITSKEDPGPVITQISQSGLQHLEALKSYEKSVFFQTRKCPVEGLHELGLKMKGLKKLDLSAICYMCDDTLIVLKDFFPCLEELNISGKIGKTRYLPVTDDGIEALSSKLKRLKKITLPYLEKLTDKSLMSLSCNCVNLMDFYIDAGPLVTESGIAFLLRHSRKLIRLSLRLWRASSWKKDGEFTFNNSISHAYNLEQLEICGSTRYDEDLYAIAKASLPLKIFRYQNYQGQGSINALPMLLKSCSSLKEFYMPGRWGLTDTDTKSFLDSFKHLGGSLTHIYLGRSNFDCSMIFTLTRNCPLLEFIDMSLSQGTSECINEDLHQNYRMKHLDLCHCELNDMALLRFGLIFPNLEFLNISQGSNGISDAGVAELLSLCPELKHLNVSGLAVSSFVNQNKENKLKLTSFFSHDTPIDDEALEVMGMRCPDLEKLYIQFCKNVTNNGVKKLMSKCEKLREINMIGCRNLSTNLWGWIMNLRPMLKVGVDFMPLKEQRKLFFGNSSIVLRGDYDTDSFFRSLEDSDVGSNDGSDVGPDDDSDSD